MGHRFGIKTLFEKVQKNDESSLFFTYTLWQLLKDLETKRPDVAQTIQEHTKRLLQGHSIDLPQGAKVGLAEGFLVVLTLERMGFLGSRGVRKYLQKIEQCI